MKTPPIRPPKIRSKEGTKTSCLISTEHKYTVNDMKKRATEGQMEEANLPVNIIYTKDLNINERTSGSTIQRRPEVALAL